MCISCMHCAIFMFHIGKRSDCENKNNTCYRFTPLNRYYLTANSCIHEGYLEYDWPWDYGWNAAGSGGSSPDMCRKVSNDGSGTPEQFW